MEKDVPVDDGVGGVGSQEAVAPKENLWQAGCWRVEGGTQSRQELQEVVDR